MTTDCRSPDLLPSLAPMKWMVAALFLALGSGAASYPAPLYDSVRLNIGLNCQWQRRCMAAQQSAMQRALGFVRVSRPPLARIHLCNRNASRGRSRIDWVGFDNCIRNRTLRTAYQRPSRMR